MMEIKRGDIFLADLGESIGSVQRGEDTYRGILSR